MGISREWGRGKEGTGGGERQEPWQGAEEVAAPCAIGHGGGGRGRRTTLIQARNRRLGRAKARSGGTSPHRAPPPQQELVSLPAGRSPEPPPPATAFLALCPFSFSFLPLFPLSLTPCLSLSLDQQDVVAIGARRCTRRQIGATPDRASRGVGCLLAAGIGRPGRERRWMVEGWIEQRRLRSVEARDRVAPRCFPRREPSPYRRQRPCRRQRP